MRFRQPPTVPKRNVLLYGPPKTGKTLGAVTAPGPILLLNADLENATWLAHKRAQSLGVELLEIDFEGYKTVQELELLAKREEGPKQPLGTVVIDPINELYAAVLNELARGAVSPTLPTYQATGTYIERMCRALCRCPHFNTVFICHDLPVKDDASGDVERLPATGTTNPSIGRRLMGMVDVVGFTKEVRLADGNRAFVAQLVNAEGTRGGDRFDVLAKEAPLRLINLTEWFAVMENATGQLAEPSESDLVGALSAAFDATESTPEPDLGDMAPPENEDEKDTTDNENPAPAGKEAVTA